LGCLLAYRIAFGEVALLAEMARFDHGSGRDFATGIGSEAEDNEREVIRRVGPRIDPELVKLAVQDALEHRKPWWSPPDRCSRPSGLAH
jgi:hypothetical protein